MYLEVVKHFIGNQAYKDLKHSFNSHRVKYKYTIKLKS